MTSPWRRRGGLFAAALLLAATMTAGMAPLATADWSGEGDLAKEYDQQNLDEIIDWKRSENVELDDGFIHIAPDGELVTLDIGHPDANYIVVETAYGMATAESRHTYSSSVEDSVEIDGQGRFYLQSGDWADNEAHLYVEADGREVSISRIVLVQWDGQTPTPTPIPSSTVTENPTDSDGNTTASGGDGDDDGTASGGGGGWYGRGAGLSIIEAIEQAIGGVFLAVSEGVIGFIVALTRAVTGPFDALGGWYATAFDELGDLVVTPFQAFEWSGGEAPGGPLAILFGLVVAIGTAAAYRAGVVG